MLTLEPGGGDCAGLAFRVDGRHAAHEAGMVWRREMIRAIYRPCLLPVRTPQGEVEALVFAANTTHADHVGELPLDETAEIIARAEGVLGPNRDYLEQLVRQLGHLGIRDEHLDALPERSGLRCPGRASWLLAGGAALAGLVQGISGFASPWWRCRCGSGASNRGWRR